MEVEEEHSCLRSRFKMADQTRGVSEVGSDFSEEEDDDVSDEGSKHLNFKTPYSRRNFSSFS